MELQEFYPNDSEIDDFFNEFISFDNARDYFKKMGILFATNKRSEIAKYASRIVFGYEDFEMMKSITATKQNYDKVSGFEIKTSKSIQELKEAFNSGEVIKNQNKLTIRESIVDPHTHSITVSYSFERKTPGKMNLISAEERKGEFRIEKGDDETGKIVVFNHSKNEDYGAVKEIITAIGQNEETKMDIVPITLERFDVKGKIDFIDKVLQYEYKKWKLEEVVTIRVRKGEESEEELEEADKKFLEGINDAILHGHNLRTNPFVIKCEKSGYYFPSIILKMAHKTEPYKISLEVQFKFRPDMPEINIVDSFMVEESAEKSYVLEKEFRKQTLDNFFHDIIGIYNNVAGAEKNIVS
ncbi:MAG: hypothetical protein ABOK23_08735 [Candidatus Methanoperedens sp.]|nr:hypothetical protein [Candidatus Methanoperedens sp.]MCZ7396449.1 hypothetical protein [Candidatus Methanoperedens sp.]